MADLTPLISLEDRYRERIAGWEAFWRLEDAETPRWLWSTSPSLQPTYTGEYPLREYFRNGRMQLAGELKTLAWREALDLDDLFVPFLQPMGGVTVFASAFGCEVDFFDHTLPWAHPVIQADDPAENVYELPRPEVTAGQLGEMLAFTEQFVTETGGRYPIAQTDLQGPLSTAYLVWESAAFMMAMYTDPEAVHHLMRLTTDLIIRFIKEQKARCPQFVPCHYPPLWLPDGMGIAISDDALAVLSPGTYEKFALPYVNELSEEFGGIVIHSCGNFTHQLDNLDKVQGLRGINFGASETPFEHIWQRFQGKTAVIPHLGLNKDIHFDSRLDYVKHILAHKSHNRGLLVLLGPAVEGLEVMMEIEQIQAFAEEVERLILVGAN